MIEFFHARADGGGGVGTGLFEGDTLLLPAVSFANLGQLSVDLLVNTLLQRGDEWHAPIELVGHLFSTAVPPIAGSSAYHSNTTTTANESPVLCVNLEVYRIPSQRVTIVQQRADVTAGMARVFAGELADWAGACGFRELVMLAGADDMLRHDPNMQRRPLRAIVAGTDKSPIRNRGMLAELTAPDAVDAKDPWQELRGCGIAPLVYRKCVDLELPFVAFVMACAEGDNVPDAIRVTGHVWSFLELPLPTSPSSGFVIPPSWSQLFGRGPDAALFL